MPHLDSKQKIFRDAVHGYISIPNEYCKKLIDTPIFQRLRRIEQTSMRVLYPCAHHDRFSHSLGVYYLGNIAFEQLKKNSEKSLRGIDDKIWSEFERTFHMACLLHDCGHAPFSHSFELYYDKPPGTLESQLRKLANNERFSKDLRDSTSNPHERVSAIILLKKYGKIIKNLGGDPLLAARMIIGCQYRYRDKRSNKDLLANALIELLNGKAFDVDKLDYAARDKWASGMSSANIDIFRLLSSLCIGKHSGKGYVLAFFKSALSVIEAVLDARNFQHMWVFSHHKVKYDQHLLTKAVTEMAKILALGDAEKGSQTLFSINTFFASKPVILGEYKLLLPSDDDLIHMLKVHSSVIPEAKEWLYRNHRLKPLWKSYAEFYSHFGTLSQDAITTVRKEAIVELDEYFVKQGISKKDFLLLDVAPTLTTISDNEIFICVDGKKTICFNQTRPSNRTKTESPSYFYIYVSTKAMKHKKKIIDLLYGIA